MIKTKVSELKHRKKKQKISRIKVSLSRLIPVINLKSRGEKNNVRHDREASFHTLFKKIFFRIKNIFLATLSIHLINQLKINS